MALKCYKNFNFLEIDIGEEINESNAKCNFLENIVQKN